MQKFFISCPLGLESHTESEIKAKWDKYLNAKLPNLTKVNGGIELETNLGDGLALNHILRSPNRVLLRLKEQKCRDLPKLFKILSKIEWKQYLKKEEVKFNISCSQSRLIHTKRIEDTSKEAIKKYFNANKIKARVLDEYKYSDAANIFLRIDNDDLTVSIDTSGDLLYKRDNIDYKGKAPLRNNLAYIIYSFFISNINEDLSEYTLIDPMCGSGTFLHEAKHKDMLVNRDFAYEVFHPKIKLEQIDSQTNNKFIGFDIDTENIKRITEDFTLINEDLFKNSQNLINDKNICIVNPPYGKKIKIKNIKTNKERSDYFQKIINRCFEKFNSDYLGIIIPDDIKLKTKHMKSLKVFNNGIWVNFNIYKA